MKVHLNPCLEHCRYVATVYTYVHTTCSGEATGQVSQVLT